MTEYKDLLSAEDTWTIIDFPVMLHGGIDSANPSQINVVHWMILLGEEIIVLGK
jgi:hypothetical protein